MPRQMVLDMFGPWSHLHRPSYTASYSQQVVSFMSYMALPFGAELWGTAANSNLVILKHFQSNMLHMIKNAPWYITSCQLQRAPTAKQVNYL